LKKTKICCGRPKRKWGGWLAGLRRLMRCCELSWDFRKIEVWLQFLRMRPLSKLLLHCFNLVCASNFVVGTCVVEPGTMWLNKYAASLWLEHVYPWWLQWIVLTCEFWMIWELWCQSCGWWLIYVY
jgi:hypothetical protein